MLLSNNVFEIDRIEVLIAMVEAYWKGKFVENKKEQNFDIITQYTRQIQHKTSGRF